jgi:hypothetical protein
MLSKLHLREQSVPTEHISAFQDSLRSKLLIQLQPPRVRSLCDLENLDLR